MFYQLPWWELECPRVRGVTSSEILYGKPCPAGSLESWSNAYEKEGHAKKSFALPLVCFIIFAQAPQSVISSPWIHQYKTLNLETQFTFVPRKISRWKRVKGTLLLCWPLTWPWKRRPSAPGSTTGESKHCQKLRTSGDHLNRGVEDCAVLPLCYKMKTRIDFVLFQVIESRHISSKTGPTTKWENLPKTVNTSFFCLVGEFL